MEKIKLYYILVFLSMVVYGSSAIYYESYFWLVELYGIFIIYLNGFQFGIRYGREGSQLSIVLSGFNEPSSLCYLNPFRYLLLSIENIHL